MGIVKPKFDYAICRITPAQYQEFLARPEVQENLRQQKTAGWRSRWYLSQQDDLEREIETALVSRNLTRLAAVRKILAPGEGFQEISPGVIAFNTIHDPLLEHWRVMLDPSIPEEERSKSVQWFVKKIWKGRAYTHNPRALIGLRRLRETYIRETTAPLGSEGERLPAEWDNLILTACVALAFDESRKREAIRLGRKWIIDVNGKKEERVPLDLIRGEYDRWLIQRCRRHLEKRGADEGPQRRDYEPLESKAGENREEILRKIPDQGVWPPSVQVKDSVAGLTKRKQDEMAAAVDDGGNKEVAASLVRLCNRLSPQQRQYVEFKATALEEGLDTFHACKYARKTMGISSVHGRQIEFQIRKRASRLKILQKSH